MRDLPPHNSSATPDLRYGFPGRLAQVLAEHVAADCAQCRLSWTFRGYYWLRPWLPLGLRHLLQQRRNRRLPVGDDWYVHRRFLADWIRAVQSELSADSECRLIHPWPDGFEWTIILTHDVETQAGVRQCARLAEVDEEYGFRSAWYFVPAKYSIAAGLLDDLRSRGHEVAVHGFNHDGRLFATRRRFEQRAKHINSVAKDWRATGFRAPMMHRQLAWMQALNVDYDASCFDVDPFQPMPGGVGTVWPFVAGKFVELPCTLPQDHTLFVTLGQANIDIWRRKLELIRRLRGMAMCIVHPDYLTSERHWALYRELLEQLRSQADAWRSLPHEAASWWRQRQASQGAPDGIQGPAAARGRAVRLADLFVEILQ